jgi:hypothetical protein
MTEGHLVEWTQTNQTLNPKQPTHPELYSSKLTHDLGWIICKPLPVETNLFYKLVCVRFGPRSNHLGHKLTIMYHSFFV